MTYTAAVIGTGRIGYLFQKDSKREQPASHSNALFENKRIEIIAGCDCDEEKLQQWHKDYPGANKYTSVTALLKAHKPHIVVVAVNEESHVKTALAVIKKRPSLVILEKPVAANLKDARKIKRVAEKYDVPILVNHERRYSLDYIKARELIESGKIGAINSVFASLWSGGRIWAEGCGKNGANSLFHDGCHLFDILCFLFNPKFTEPVIDSIEYSKKKKAVTQLNVHFKNRDTLYHIELSGKKKYFGFDIDIRGAKGRIVIGNGYFDVFFAKESPFYTNFYSLVQDTSLKRPDKTGYFSNMVANGVDFLDGKKKLISTIDTGVRVIKILDRIEKKIIAQVSP